MIVRFLGTGTSHGIPVIGCSCRVCTSADRRNLRWRSSILIRSEKAQILFDTSQEFRLQALRTGLDSLNAVFYTHGHADHVMGIDDLRIFSRSRSLDVYGDRHTIEGIRRRFDYIFTVQDYGGGIPHLELRSNEEGAVTIEDIRVQRIPIFHGRNTISGYRVGSMAYLTDCSGIPESSMPLLQGLDTVIIGALRYHPHPTHFSVDQAVEVLKKLNPRRGYLTHLSHAVEHKEVMGYLPNWIEPAYDGLSLEFPDG